MNYGLAKRSSAGDANFFVKQSRCLVPFRHEVTTEPKGRHEIGFIDVGNETDQLMLAPTRPVRREVRI